MPRIKSLPRRIESAVINAKRSRGRSMALKRAIVPRVRRYTPAPTTGAKNVNGVLIGGPQGPERKKIEVAQSSVAVTNAAPYIQSLTSAISQGTNVSQRIGDRIKVKAVDLQFNIQSSGATATTAGQTFIDVFLILDTQPQETTAAAGTIFQTPSSNLTYIQLDSLERFQVLKRERINLDPAMGLSQVWTWHLSADLGVRFGAGTTAPMSNDILVCATTAQTAANSYTPQLQYISRLTYTDE